MKTLFFLLLLFSITYGQNIVSLEIGNKWYYEYSYSSNKNPSKNYLLEKEVIDNTLFNNKVYKKIKVQKIIGPDTTFVKYEYWYSDSIIFMQTGFDPIYYLEKTYDKNLTIDSLYVDGLISINEKNVLGELKNVQEYLYLESGMENIELYIETSELFGIINVSEYGDVDTAELTWRVTLKLIKAIIENMIYDIDATHVEESNLIFEGYELQQNYPNPFNPITNIEFHIPSKGLINITVFDLLGKEISVLKNEVKDKGDYKVSFNGVNLPSGIYIYRLITNNKILTRKMILLR